MDKEKSESTTERLENLARDVFRATLPYISEKEPGFRVLMFLDVDGELKPVLLVGTAHPLPFEDGSCIVILNPSHGLEKIITPSTNFVGGLKEFVAGECDEAIHLWHDAYKNGGRGDGSVIDRYKARKPAAPRRSHDWKNL